MLKRNILFDCLKIMIIKLIRHNYDSKISEHMHTLLSQSDVNKTFMFNILHHMYT